MGIVRKKKSIENKIPKFDQSSSNRDREANNTPHIFVKLQPNTLTGYYSGDIKTRKTVQASEIKAGQLGLRSSEQLKELR